MQHFQTAFWKTAPMFRLLMPLIAGILFGYYINANFYFLLSIGLLGVFLWISFEIIPLFLKFKFSWISGIGFNLLFICLGTFLISYKNIENNSTWIGNQLFHQNTVIISLAEPLIEKNKSYKSTANVERVYSNNEWSYAEGNILVYFSKEENKPNIQYGSLLLIKKPLQNITNAGNPGGFDYRRFSLFQNIGQQVFLKQGDYQILDQKKISPIGEWLNHTRQNILSIIRKNITETNEQSIAEALLIGYRADLDRDLVQAYSNTGVVHIIAISGLHLAMIYGLIVLLFQPFNNKKWMPFVKAVASIIVLWTFTLIAGSAPSILRSAVMCTFIVVGETFSKRSNIYNNLAASAFVILLFNPFSLWDVGFQLSYSAVFSIVLFSQSITNWFYFTNKVVKGIWNLMAVTISAQILTMPLILYHFHQFPVLFLFANLLAVPFSGLILYAELLLIVVAPFTEIAHFVGALTEHCIHFLNQFILSINAIPFAQITSIQINILQTVALFVMMIGISFWFLKKQRKGLLVSLAALLLFFTVRTIDLIHCNQQQKIIVYNVPQHQAMDLIEGRQYQFLGDTVLTKDGFLRNFHLQPSRILHRIEPAGKLHSIAIENHIIAGTNKKIIVIDDALPQLKNSAKIKVDAVLISKNPKLYISQLLNIFDCQQVVFDSSNPLWKINKWKKDCDSLHLRHYSIPEQGAFEMEL